MDIASPEEQIGPCAGFRVLDFSTMVSGPLAGQNLGDLGADVIKIETLFGDTARWVGPPERAGLNGFFTQFNRNKRAISIDLKSAAGKEIAQTLARDADVVIENFRPGVADRLGIGYQRLSRDNPGLVYVSISGFGPDGPYAGQPVYDLVIQGMSGMMPVQGGDGPPQMNRSVIADKNAAITAASCALAALLARERNDGRGQHVQVPMINAYAQLALPDVLATESFEPKPDFAGEVPDMYRTWQCADGHLVGMPIEDRQYRNLCLCLGREDLAEDERFKTIGARMPNNRLMNELLDEEFIKWPWRDLLEALHEHDVPFAPIYDVDDFIADPQVQHNRTVFLAEDPQGGTTRYIRHPGIYPQTPATLRRHPPRYGEHTEELLLEAGFDHAQIAAWRAEQVIA
ncbi:MAG: crotonobetainyl-CoA:carnitine CoA-transferase CaiB-like acyl-CoA transferase [Halieaceae bacterium]|jgi:crotonobetainyl-CoA:carnitine CoA-transferase CaiB-like acyl-CoA transferase